MGRKLSATPILKGLTERKGWWMERIKYYQWSQIYVKNQHKSKESHTQLLYLFLFSFLWGKWNKEYSSPFRSWEFITHWIQVLKYHMHPINMYNDYVSVKKEIPYEHDLSWTKYFFLGECFIKCINAVIIKKDTFNRRLHHQKCSHLRWN